MACYSNTFRVLGIEVVLVDAILAGVLYLVEDLDKPSSEGACTNISKKWIIDDHWQLGPRGLKSRPIKAPKPTRFAVSAFPVRNGPWLMVPMLPMLRARAPRLGQGSKDGWRRGFGAVLL